METKELPKKLKYSLKLLFKLPFILMVILFLTPIIWVWCGFDLWVKIAASIIILYVTVKIVFWILNNALIKIKEEENVKPKETFDEKMAMAERIKNAGTIKAGSPRIM